MMSVYRQMFYMHLFLSVIRHGHLPQYRHLSELAARQEMTRLPIIRPRCRLPILCANRPIFVNMFLTRFLVRVMKTPDNYIERSACQGL
ncbi:hypothetical protein U14_02279 [Candidatus Moduliflexus flocculans]|uniref:Uncharacterized protein n=1 Tax=Candidatus Moduliflexus flocculans TaxID=1499966 RepID=A0A0S6VU16_9BACT|nr:hypothetical protein U14_02279 [Candidatus Moduliflexus flocculans]